MKRPQIERLLPALLQRTLSRQPGATADGPPTPLDALLDIMEAFQTPVEEAAEILPAMLDPRTTSDEFVYYLADWMDLDRLFARNVEFNVRSKPIVGTELGRLRELVATAAYLARWRGTREGLLLFLRVVTGEKGFRIDENETDSAGRPRPFHMVVTAPPAARVYETLIERIVKSEKPAHVTYELRFNEASVAP